ncbi:MAG: PaaI family thioesterase [Desulfobacterales bacterium]
MDQIAFQDESYCKGNLCWVCGNDNAHGLYIKSYWDGEESVCTWQAQKHHTAGWPHVLNGGIISGIIDCHCVQTAMAANYKDTREEGNDPSHYWFATASLKVDFLRPTPVDRPVQLRARVKELHTKKALVTCSLYSDGVECARGEVIAVQVPAGLDSRKND